MVRFVPYYSLGNFCIAGTSYVVSDLVPDIHPPILPPLFLAQSAYPLFMPTAWMLFWNSSNLPGAQVFVTINTFTQLYYMTTKLGPMDTSSTSSILTHVVSKTFAGIGVLDFLHNGSVAFFKDHPATLPVRVLTGLGFGLASAASDWIFGGCLVYDLVALAFGQSGSWRTLLGAYAAGSAAIVGMKNVLR